MNGEAGQIQSIPPRKVGIADVEHALCNLWQHLHQDLPEGKAITRACMSNLIIYCDDAEQSRAVADCLPALVQVHPARVILLTGTCDVPPATIEAHVSGHYCALSSGWQVCAEEIHLIADEPTNRRLPSVTRALLVGDLPTTLWWASRQPPPSAGKLFYKLADMSEQIIYDSIGWTNPSKGMQAMSRWVSAERSEYVIYNLAWRRLKPWRRILCQTLDPQVQPGALDKVSRITIEHGPHAQAMAMLLLGWLGARLGWKPLDGKLMLGKETLWHFDIAGQRVPVTVRRLPEGTAEPQRLDWYWREGGEERHAIFALLGDERLGIVEQGSDVPFRVTAAPTLDISELVAAQLAHRARDKLFEQSLEVGDAMTTVLGV